MLMLKKAFLGLFLLLGMQPLSLEGFLGCNFEDEAVRGEVTHMACSLACLPQIMTSDSKNAKIVMATSLLAASSTGFLLVNELMRSESRETPVWKTLCYSLPMVGFYVSSLVYDISRVSKAHTVVSRNKDLTPSDVKLNQGFCLGIELFLRGCSLCSRNYKSLNLSSTITTVANIIEHYRLTSRWFKMPSGLPIVEYNGVLVVKQDEEDDVAVKAFGNVQDIPVTFEENSNIWRLKEVSVDAQESSFAQ